MSDERNESRQRFADLATHGDDDEVDRISSAIHLGLTLLGMIESIAQTRQMLVGMGKVNPDDTGFASSTIIGHKSSGDLFHITVNTATEEEADEHTAMLQSAADLGTFDTDTGAITKH